MRLEQALGVDPHNADPDAVAAALATLRVEVARLRREEADRRDQLIEAGELRRQRIDIAGRLASAMELHQRDAGRVIELLAALDAVAPERANGYRAAWGVWPAAAP